MRGVAPLMQQQAIQARSQARCTSKIPESIQVARFQLCAYPMCAINGYELPLILSPSRNPHAVQFFTIVQDYEEKIGGKFANENLDCRVPHSWRCSMSGSSAETINRLPPLS